MSFRNLYMIKVQKSKQIKIIRDRQTTDRQMNLHSNTHDCELNMFLKTF